MTNGEKMRKMTNKELASEITELILNALYSPSVLHGKFTYQQMLDSNLEWLEKEVDESD
jgi:hypothetical protein